MHLSLLSDASVSRDGFAANAPRAPHGRAHLEGVMRGLVFLAAISVLLCLAIVTGHAQPRDASAGYAQSFDPQR